MATRTARLTANTSWQSAVSGPMDVIINTVTGFADIYIGTTEPSLSEANTFLLKPVAGENFLEVTLETGDDLYVKQHGAGNVAIAWIEMSVA